MWYASGNRDEAVFTDPYDLDVARENNDHVTFGKGSPHLCLGNLLARAEIRIMFENSSRAWPTSSWPVTCRGCRSNFVNGIKKLPVEGHPGLTRPGGPRQVARDATCRGPLLLGR